MPRHIGSVCRNHELLFAPFAHYMPSKEYIACHKGSALLRNRFPSGRPVSPNGGNKVWIKGNDLITGTSDNGTSDNGTSDNGTSDNGTSDNGTSDNGTSDNGTSDNGTSDNGTSDNGTSNVLFVIPFRESVF